MGFAVRVRRTGPRFAVRRTRCALCAWTGGWIGVRGNCAVLGLNQGANIVESSIPAPCLNLRSKLNVQVKILFISGNRLVRYFNLIERYVRR